MKKLLLLPLLIGTMIHGNAQSNTTCNAQFTQTFAGNTVHFIPALMGDSATTRHLWIFGDGTASDMRSPFHTYVSCGVYTVKHIFKAFGPNNTILCADSVLQTVSIACPPPCTLQAGFTSVISSATPQAVTMDFSNTTLNIQPGDSVRWTFGDNSAPAFTGNAQHAYTANGTYNVCLRVKRPSSAGNIGGACVSEYCRPVVVSGISGCNNQASFTSSVAPNAPLRRLFTNTSPLPSSNYTATWTFGDGTGANSWNAEHTYAAPGRYRVCLRIVYSATCIAEKCDSVTIVAANAQIPCDSARVSFTYRRENARPNRIYFLTLTNTPIAQETWTITPLSGQNVPVVTLNQYNPIYEFTQAGSYRVCLRAVIRTGCVKEYCNVIQVAAPTNTCMLTAFPNPAQNQVSVVVLLQQPQTIVAKLFNNQNTQVGSISQAGTTGANQVSFNISALPPGIYTIRVESGGRICTARFEKI
ncbi:MAG: PKD domain-containing protein [Bacteroidota bacterium]